MKKKILIVGGGKLAQIVIHHLTNYDANTSIIGFVDDTIHKSTSKFNFSCLGSLEDIDTIYRSTGFDALVLAIGYNYLSKTEQVFTALSERYDFYSFIHPLARVDVTATIGKGCFLCEGVHVEQRAMVSDNVFLYTNVLICHDSEIKSHSFIGPAVIIAGASIIGKRCMLGVGTIVSDNVNIADDIKTGAGTIVNKSLLQAGVYVGGPAKKITNL